MLDEVSIRFDQEKLFLLNIAIGVIMYGVALSIKTSDLMELKKRPKAVVTGVTSQFLLLPMITACLILLVDPLPSLALGMLLVASCPGGNVSNFFTSLAGGNVALSVSLTIVASLLAVFVTPINFLFWSSMVIDSELTTTFDLELLPMVKTVFLIIALPLFLGIFTARKLPKMTLLIKTPIKYLSFLLLVTIIGLAFSNNIDIFMRYYDLVIYLVLLHNGLAFLSGYIFSRSMGNSKTDSMTISIETGIQNSGLGLVIIFAFFGGNGGMAIITAWWGIWHIISGFIISQVFAYHQRKILIAS